MQFGKSIAIAAYAATLTAVTAVSSPAFAGQPIHEPQVAVHYDDLKLSHRVGAEALVARVGRGAKEVCGREPFIADLRGQALYNACVKASTDRAIASVGVPLVTEAYQRQLGESQRVAGN